MNVKLLAALLIFSSFIALAPQAHADDCKEVLATSNELFEKASQDYPSVAESCVPMKAWRVYVKSTTYKTCMTDKDGAETVQGFVAAVDQACGK